MPAYNASHYIGEAIDSILNQTFDDFELLIINDGSSDRTREIILSYKDQRIRYVEQQNQGVARTLNNGIALIKSKYIWRHDADDISLPRKLEEQVRFLEAHPEIALCATQVAFMTPNSKVAWKYRQPKNHYFGDLPYREVTFEDFASFSPITHGTVLVKTKVMKELGGYREAFVSGEDLDAWLRLLTRYRAVVLSQCLSLHRLSDTSATVLHGWKDDFYAQTAKDYYLERKSTGKDTLEISGQIHEPRPPNYSLSDLAPQGFTYRSDLLDFRYKVYLDAKDIENVVKVLSQAVRDGWRDKRTWKAIVFPLIGVKMVQIAVRIKKVLKNLGFQRN